MIGQLERAAGFTRDDTEATKDEKLRTLLAPAARDAARDKYRQLLTQFGQNFLCQHAGRHRPDMPARLAISSIVMLLNPYWVNSSIDEFNIFSNASIIGHKTMETFFVLSVSFSTFVRTIKK